MNTTIQPGDIIAVKAEPDDWFSKCIAWLSNSDTSHAVLLYREDAIIHMIANGVNINNAEIHTGQGAYVLRRKNAPDPQPLFRVAKAYQVAGARFDFPALVLLAGLLVFRKIKINKTMMALISKLLMQSITVLDRMIRRAVLHQKGDAMVCSQFVYQVFHDCGADYRIDVDFTYQRQSGNMLTQAVGDTICLADIISDGPVAVSAAGSVAGMKTDDIMIEAIMTEEIRSEGITTEDIITDDIRSEGITTEHDMTEAIIAEEIAAQLYRELTGEKQDDAVKMLMGNKIVIDNETVYWTNRFIEKVRKLQQVLGTDIPLSGLFVTPGDLVAHARNLELVGMVDLKLIH
jgi:hypothetical protein